MRNRRIAELREARARGQQEQQAIRHMSHMSLVEQYQKLIPLFKYKKNDKTIDEFGTTECVICMEAFNSSSKVRKIPSCRHILHDECLMKWLSGSQQ